MHQCLRDNFQKLQDGCRKEELKLNIIQSRDVRLRPKLNKACSDEITVFCQGIQPGTHPLSHPQKAPLSSEEWLCQGWKADRLHAREDAASF